MAGDLDTVQAAAEWLARTSRSEISGAVVPAIRDRFGLNAAQACEAIREATKIRTDAHRNGEVVV